MPFSSSVSGSAFLRARSSGCHPQCVQASSPAYSIMQHRADFDSVQRFSSSAIPTPPVCRFRIWNASFFCCADTPWCALAWTLHPPPPASRRSGKKSPPCSGSRGCAVCILIFVFLLRFRSALRCLLRTRSAGRLLRVKLPHSRRHVRHRFKSQPAHFIPSRANRSRSRSIFFCFHDAT